MSGSVRIRIQEESFDWSSKRKRGGASADVERVIMFFIIMIFCGALVTGIIGSTLYVMKIQSNDHIRLTSCSVEATEVKSDGIHCYVKECVPSPTGGVPTCTDKEQECHLPVWTVSYSEVDSEGELILNTGTKSFIYDSPYKTASEATQRLAQHGVSSKSKCNYFASDPLHVTWGYDDPEPWMITMIVSWSVVGLFLCALGFGWFFSKARDV